MRNRFYFGALSGDVFKLLENSELVSRWILQFLLRRLNCVAVGTLSLSTYERPFASENMHFSECVRRAHSQSVSN